MLAFACSVPAISEFETTKKAAEQGDAEAQLNLGVMYANGEMDLLCREALVIGDQNAATVHCQDIGMLCLNALASGDSAGVTVHCHGMSGGAVGSGMSFLCKDAITRGDQSAAFVHCN